MERTNIRGVGFDNVSLDEALEICEGFMAGYRAGGGAAKRIHTPNAEIVEMCVEQPEKRELINSADLVIPDGAGVVLAGKILKTPLPKGKVAGIELLEGIVRESGSRGRRIFLLGSKPDAGNGKSVAETAREKLLEKYPDALIVSSQKALAIAPGIAMVLLSPQMLERVERIESGSMYFDFKDHLKNGERGQTPFTPAVGIVYELQDRLHAIEEAGGIETEVARVYSLASDFRSRIKNLPVSTPPYRMSNALTLMLFDRPVAQEVNARLVDEYGFVLNPCGGTLASVAARVAHIGDLTMQDNAALIEALEKVLG